MRAEDPLVRKLLLMGGVGNKLFQLCKALSYDEAVDCYNIEDFAELKFFLEVFKNWSFHHDWLDVADLTYMSNVTIKQPSIWIRISLYQTLLLYVLRALSGKSRFDSTSMNLFEFGYFQDPMEIEKSTVVQLALKISRNLKPDHRSYDFAFHFRGGDFDEHDRPKKEELEQVSGKRDVAIVTNDRQTVIGLAPMLETRIISSTNALDDFCILAKAKTLYCSNSTFCFWAAAVGKFASNQVHILSRGDSYWKLLNE